MNAEALAAVPAASASGALAAAALMRTGHLASVLPAIARWRAALSDASAGGAVIDGKRRRRTASAAALAGVAAGYSLLGAGGAALGLVAGPLALRGILDARRNRYAVQIDACAAEFATALAAVLSSGNSVRGALLAAPAATPRPLRAEAERAAVDLALGQSVVDALAGMRGRTGSARIEALTGAIALHRGSGGDLVSLLRELAAAFRARDAARRDARTSTAQARFTAIVVGAIPLTLAIAGELAKPGAVSGVFEFAPTAMLMAVACALVGAGGWACHRAGRVR